VNLNLIRRGFADKRISLTIYAAGVLLYSLFILAIWPSMETSGLSQIWDTYPENLKKAFGATINFASFDGFLTLEYLSNMWVIIMAVFAIGTGANALSGEIERGTMELLLAQPITRRSLVISRHFYFSVALVGLIIATLAPIAAGASIVGGDLNYAGLLAVGILAFFFYGAIGSVTFMFSSMFNSRGMSISLASGIIIFAYALDLLSKFNDTVNKFRFLSLFNYYDPYRYLHDASYAWGDVAVLAGIIILTTGVAVTWFERRDIAV
jgi:ABC-2 type transport system permease protein